MSGVDELTSEQQRALPRLIHEAVVVADYGLIHDGCPFCGRIVEHEQGCIALAFGATTGRAVADPGPAVRPWPGTPDPHHPPDIPGTTGVGGPAGATRNPCPRCGLMPAPSETFCGRCGNQLVF
jgi:hypothetical protein